LIVVELLKLVLVERLFGLTRGKLMKFPAFAWRTQDTVKSSQWLKNTEA
jgi:hypothetical protein